MRTARDHPIPPERAHALAFLLLALFYVSYNLNSVFYQVRRANPADLAFSYAGYFAGLLLFALAMPAIERLAARPGRAFSAGRLAVPGLLLLPPVFCLAAPLVTPEGYAGNRFFNTFQPLLWAMYTPIVLRLFFLRCAPASRTLCYFICVGAGHLCWGLLMPFVSGPGADLPVQFNEVLNRFLPFLNVTRCGLSILVAAVAYRLLTLPVPEPPAALRASHAAPGPQSRRRPFPPLVCILLPLAVCFLVNGFFSFRFFVRISARGPLMEYMHLALALFFPLLGLLAQRAEKRALFYPLAAAVLIFAASPLYPLLEVGSPPRKAMFVLFSAANQQIVVIGTLLLGRFTSRAAFPALVACGAWLTPMVSLPANAAARALFAAGPGLYHAALCVLALACTVSVLVLRGAFPLPPPAAARPVPGGGKADGEDARAKFDAFVAFFALTRREAEILEGVVAGRAMGPIGDGLGISERTARHHLTGILKKTDTPSRQRLELLFAGWLPGAPGRAAKGGKGEASGPAG